MAAPKPSAPFDLIYAMTLPAKEAVAYFKQKGLRVSGSWHEVLSSAHDKAFTVANCAKLDVLQTIRNALQDALQGGVSFSEFKKRLIPLLQEAGWWGKAIDMGTGEVLKMHPGTTTPVQYGSPRRLELIYRVNLQSSFMAGRRVRQMEGVQDRPYGMYVAVMDSRTRPTHRSLNGMVFRLDDPMYQTFYPPNGFNCRCRVRALSPDQVGSEADQYPLSSSKGRLDKVTVPLSKANPSVGTTEVSRFMLTPPGYPPALRRYVQTDPGWSHAPGAAWQPDVSKYDDDLVAEFKKALAKK